MKTFLLALLGCFCLSTLAAQTVMLGGVPRDTSFTLDGTYKKERKYRPYIEPVRARLPAGVRAYEGLTYKTVATPQGKHGLEMNLYRPEDGRKLPVLLMIHGGGWNSGRLDLQVPMAQQVAARGYVAVAVEYRLIPEALYPAAVDDLEDALEWLVRQAGTYGIDTTRMAVSGCSAGGQLAMLLGMKNRSGRIGAVVNMDGTCTFVSDESVGRAEAARQAGKPLPVDALWLGGTYRERKAVWEDASPLYWITGRSAPVCFINSSIPRFHNGRDEAIAKLRAFGTYTEVHTHADTPHPFWFFHPWFGPTVDYTTAFLDKIFRPEAARE